jgi:Arc/MetJ-type ribon-helix-helix transcriptional regulator
MTVQLPPDVQPIVDQANAAGRGADEAHVVCQALRLFAQFERRRETLKREIKKGIESGDSIPGEVVFAELEQLARSRHVTSP